jgi:Rod binding domain-containing protein
MSNVNTISATPMMPAGIDLNAYAGPRQPNDRRAMAAAATALESVFLSMVMKEMRQTLEGSSMFSGDKGDVLGGLFDHYLGQHLAPSGALGIAAMVKRSWEMRGNYGHQQQAAATATRTDRQSVLQR